MAGFADGKLLVRLGVQAPQTLVVLRITRTHTIDPRDGLALLQGFLLVAAFLVVELPFQLVGQQAVEAQGVLEAVAVTVNAVLRLRTEDGRAGEGGP
ncbi:hypothetical protein D3C76_1170550 [compost metagenome]